MNKGLKFAVAVLSVAVVVCCAVAGFSTLNKPDETTSQTQSGESSDTTVDTTTTEVSTTQAVSELKELILGKWTDTAGMSGYEFFSDGRVAFTYVNLEGFNIPFSGTAENAAYTLEGDSLSIKYSIYTATIEKRYSVRIENDTLYMQDVDDRNTATYRRADTLTTEPTETTTKQSTTSSQSTADDLIGSWENVNKGVKYTFKGNGKVAIVLTDASLPALGSNKINANIDGTYSVNEGKLTVEYPLFNDTVTAKYSFDVSGNSLKLTDDAGDTVYYSRVGTSFEPADESELLGMWRDGADMSGYEFKENGIVKVTFVNITIPVINFPVNGTYTGSYEIDGNNLTISYSIYGNTISESYTYEINGNVLSMTSKDDGNVATYLKK